MGVGTPPLPRASRHSAEASPSPRGECLLTLSKSSLEATPLSERQVSPALSRGWGPSSRGCSGTTFSLFRSCALTTSPRRHLLGIPSEQGLLMAWQYVSRKGGGKGRNSGVQDQLLQSMTAMQNSISRLAQSICTKPPPGSKGQGKGRPPKGQGKGVKSSPGERKSPKLKPEEERAEPTTEEVKCPKCPNTYN